MRKTYEIDGLTFHMRTFNQRDMMRVTGKLSLLPTELRGGGPASASKANDLADGLLALCSIKPKITLDEPEEIPDGTLPVSEIPDAIYQELMKRLASDSGFGAEAAADVRPSSATSEVS